MRIIAGEYRGRRLQAPKGDATRPTTDRVRESLMSALSSARGGFEGAVVLDAFAGSGALGLEALSRGAASAHFFEKDGVALRALCANVEALGVPTLGAGARARLHRADVLERPPCGRALPSTWCCWTRRTRCLPKARFRWWPCLQAPGACARGHRVLRARRGGKRRGGRRSRRMRIVPCVAPQVRGYCRGSVEAVVRGGSRDPRARRRVAVVRGAAAVPAPEEGKRSIR